MKDDDPEFLVARKSNHVDVSIAPMIQWTDRHYRYINLFHTHTHTHTHTQISPTDILYVSTFNGSCLCFKPIIKLYSHEATFFPYLIII